VTCLVGYMASFGFPDESDANLTAEASAERAER